MEASLVQVESSLVQAFQDYTGRAVEPTKVQTHRWRYAQAERESDEGSTWDPQSKIVICGDLFGAGIEGALLSGAHLAGRIMGAREARERSSDNAAPLFAEHPRTGETTAD